MESEKVLIIFGLHVTLKLRLLNTILFQVANWYAQRRLEQIILRHCFGDLKTHFLLWGREDVFYLIELHYFRLRFVCLDSELV
jgi:hypothetical protein